MNNLEHLHEQIVSKEYSNSFDEGGHTQLDTEKIAVKSAEITTDIAIKFLYFVQDNYYYNSGCWFNCETDQYTNPSDLFNEFITNHYGK